jgi:hypothetical protein
VKRRYEIRIEWTHAYLFKVDATSRVAATELVGRAMAEMTPDLLAASFANNETVQDMGLSKQFEDILVCEDAGPVRVALVAGR